MYLHEELRNKTLYIAYCSLNVHGPWKLSVWKKYERGSCIWFIMKWFIHTTNDSSLLFSIHVLRHRLPQVTPTRCSPENGGVQLLTAALIPYSCHYIIWTLM